LKVVFVTSQITYVRDNYCHLVERVLAEPIPGIRAQALVLLDIGAAYILKTGLGLVALGAPIVGLTLLRNLVASRCGDPRPRAAAAGIPVYRSPSMNAPATVAWLKGLQPDLVVNMRTRNIYKPEILGVPAHGCINIHHGLLPENRGLMCDLWAWVEGRPVGFTIHRMNPKIDDGEILVRREVPTRGARSYVDLLYRSSRIEAEALRDLLAQFARDRAWKTLPNAKTDRPHTKNPTPSQIAAFRRRGFRL